MPIEFSYCFAEQRWRGDADPKSTFKDGRSEFRLNLSSHTYTSVNKQSEDCEIKPSDLVVSLKMKSTNFPHKVKAPEGSLTYDGWGLHVKLPLWLEFVKWIEFKDFADEAREIHLAKVSAQLSSGSAVDRCARTKAGAREIEYAQSFGRIHKWQRDEGGDGSDCAAGLPPDAAAGTEPSKSETEEKLKKKKKKKTATKKAIRFEDSSSDDAPMDIDIGLDLANNSYSEESRPDSVS